MLQSICFLIFLPWALGSMHPVGVKEIPSAAGAFESFVLSDKASGTCKTVSMKIIYPAARGSRDVDFTNSPHPVVIFFGGASTESNRYQWLGERLVKRNGVIYITTELVGLVGGGTMLLPMEGGRKKPTHPNLGLKKLFEKLKELNEHGRFAGHMNLNKVVVGGHSYGGRFALVEAANDRFFPNIVGTFVYAAHAIVYPEPGFTPGSVMMLDGYTPLLLMVGSKDYRLQAMGAQLGTDFSSPEEPVMRTFRHAVEPGRLCYYVELEGFNHMAPIFPEDRVMKEGDSVSPRAKHGMKQELYRIISLFVQEQAFDDNEAARQLNRVLFHRRDRYIKFAERKGMLFSYAKGTRK